MARRRINDLSAFIKDMVKELRHGNEVEMRMALREKAVEFCRETGAFIEEMEPIDIVANQMLYNIEPQYEAYVNTVEKVWMKYSASDTKPRLLMPSEYEIDDGDASTITLAYEPTSNIAGGLIIRATLIPYPDCEEFPENFLVRYGPAIVAGALAHFQGMTGKDWSDPMKYQENMLKFRGGKSDATVRRLTQGGKTGSVSMTNPVPWL